MEGAAVERVFTPLPALLRAVEETGPLEGQRIAGIRARGKHLLIHFGDGRALRTHLRMSGSWHLYRAGEDWLRPPAQARVALQAGGFVAVCFNAPRDQVELLRPAQLRRHRALRALGPDATSDGFDRAAAIRRLSERGELPIAVALLTQAAVAGIGNVVKAEALFLTGQDPFARVETLPPERLGALVDAARGILLASRAGGPRTTRRALEGPRLWVYGRKGEPCLRCGTRIEMSRMGDAGRSTYYCPSCQRP
ncbi:MAG: Fpg/Nei family DNA glycosylase [Myxococcales bacterium]